MTELWAIRTFITRLLNTPYILPAKSQTKCFILYTLSIQDTRCQQIIKHTHYTHTQNTIHTLLNYAPNMSHKSSINIV